MPQASISGMPAAWKKRRMSGSIGAAPVIASLMLPPKMARILLSTSLSASSYCLRRSRPGSLPALSASRILVPVLIAHLKIACLAPPWAAEVATAVSWTFSKMRGTDGKYSGLISLRLGTMRSWSRSQ